MSKKFGLGRGMDAILGGGASFENTQASGATEIGNLNINEIEANPDQPRKDFDPEEMQNLCDSIKHYGVFTPITVRKLNDHKYQIIAGERRFRASKMAGLDTIPAYIKTANDNEVAEMALIENIQRTDLNAIEIALSYKSIMENGNYTQEELSSRVGKNRTTVSNYLRLLGLPAEIQKGLQDHKIENGHARALLSIEDLQKQLEVFKQIVDNGLSVRKVEEIAKSLKEQKTPKQVKSYDNAAEYAELISSIGDKIGSKVEISKNAKGKGKISICFDSDEDFERIIGLFDTLN